MTWTTRLEERDAVLRTFCERDRVWAAYLLADLDPPYRRHARFYLAAADGEDRAVVLVYTPPEFAAIISMGDAEGIAAALAQIPDLPQRAHLLIPPEHREAFATDYRPAEWWRTERMVLVPAELSLPAAIDRAERLGAADRAAIEALLAAREFEAYFTGAMLEAGIYCGVRDAGRLVAVAGSHVVSPASRIAAIGNVYTAPEARGRGYASAATAAVACALFEQGCEQIVLNVNTENRAAIRVYERLGFAMHTEFWEAPGALWRGAS